MYFLYDMFHLNFQSKYLIDNRLGFDALYSGGINFHF